MKVLAFAASSSRGSINGALVRHAASRLRAELLHDVEVEILDLNDFEMPIYSIDREHEGGIPDQARRFFARIGAADGLLISYAEHNGAYTAAFKNLFDWASRIQAKVFQGKPAAVLATSPGGRGGAGVLKGALESAPHYGAEVVGSLSVPRFQTVFDPHQGVLTDEGLAAQLGEVLRRFAVRLTEGPPPAAAPPPPSGPSMWDARYAVPFAAYGSEPNAFLHAVAGRIPPGPVLVIAAGEGRDAVFLAARGHSVTAMDQSAVGLANAAALAASQKVALTTVVADLADFDFGHARWAGIVAIWAHLPSALRARVHAACVQALAPGGVFILEAYSPAHLALPGKGGPPVADMLVDPATARRELEGLRFELCQQALRDVAEGRDHQGPSATTQVLAIRH